MLQENHNQNKNHKPGPHLTRPSVNPKPSLCIYKTQAAFGVMIKSQVGMECQESLPRLSCSHWHNTLVMSQEKKSFRTKIYGLFPMPPQK